MSDLETKLIDLTAAGQAIAPDALAAAQHSTQLYGAVDLLTSTIPLAFGSIGLFIAWKFYCRAGIIAKQWAKDTRGSDGEGTLICGLIIAAISTIILIIGMAGLCSTSSWIALTDPNAYLVHRIIAK